MENGLIEPNEVDVLYLGEPIPVLGETEDQATFDFEIMEPPRAIKTNPPDEPGDLILLNRASKTTEKGELYPWIQEQYPDQPLILLDDADHSEIASEALSEGVQDYLVINELSPSLLKRSIQYALERWDLNRELHEYRSKLEQSNQELQNFAYVISHDLKEPLRMVTGFLELLEEHYGDELDDKAHEYIQKAVDGSHRMKGMISDLLTYSRVKSRGEPLEVVHPKSVLDNIRGDFEQLLDEENVNLEYGDLPEVLADPGQLRHLFQNLLENAVKFSDGGDVRVAITADSKDDLCEFHFKDNGIGIPPESQDEIFKIFRRIHKDDYEGTGLGLALCRRIVNRHGGTIDVESDGSSGTTFHFTLQEA